MPMEIRSERPTGRRIRGVAARVACAALLLFAGAAAAQAAGPDANTRCRRDLGKGTIKLSASLMSVQARCLNEQMNGRLLEVDCLAPLSPDFPGAGTVAKSVSVLSSLANRSCSAADHPTVNGYGTCPSPCENHSVDTYEQVSECLVCTTAARTSAAIESLYGSPPSDASRDAIRCQLAIGKAARIYLVKRTTAQQRCQYSEDSEDSGLRCKFLDEQTDPRGYAIGGLRKAGKRIAKCSALALAELDTCAGDAEAQQECVARAIADAGDSMFDDVYPRPTIQWESPPQGAFTTDASVTARGRIVGARGESYNLFINGEEVPLDSAGVFVTQVEIDPSKIFQPVLAEVRQSTNNVLAARKLRTLAYGPSHGLGQPLSLVMGLRVNDSGLDALEPTFNELVDIDLSTLISPGTVVISQYEYFCFPGFDCATTDIVINPTDGSGAPPPSISGYRLSVDSSGDGVGYVSARIDLDNLFVSARAVELDCDINVQTSGATITGNYDLLRDANSPTQVDVVQLGGVNIAFNGFSNSTDCGDGFGAGLLESLIEAFAGDVESLVGDGFRDYLNSPQPGDDDPIIASSIESALADIDITGPVGAGLGVGISAPIADIPIDYDGVTLATDLATAASVGGGGGQCDPPEGAPDLDASLLVPSVFPAFGPTTPVAGRGYHVGIGLASSAFNQLLASQTECGLLVTRIDRAGNFALTTGLLGAFFPELNDIFDEVRPVHVDMRPEFSPVMTGDPGPDGELATMVIGHLVLDIEAEEETGDVLVLSAVVGVKVGLDLSFDNDFGVLGFDLGEIAPSDIDVAVVDNPYEINEAVVKSLFGALLPTALPTVTSSLEAFPLPGFTGQDLLGVEVSRIGDFLGIFSDLVPQGTILNDDYTGGEFGAADIALAGNAFWAEDSASIFQPFPRRLRLTNNGGGQTGAAWWTGAQLEASADWSTTFRVQMTFQNNGGADGMAFHLQSQSTDALPWINGTGLDGNRLSVVVDTWDNGEGTDESLQVFLNGSRIYINDLNDFGLDPDPGSSIQVFRVEIGYDARAASLRVAMFDEGGGDYVDDRVPVSLNGFGPSWAGFSAATGGAGQNHDVRTWQLRGRAAIGDLVENATTVAMDFRTGDYQTAAIDVLGDALWFSDPDPFYQPWPQRLRLTGNATFQNGAAWYNGHRIDAASTWSTDFRFQITYPYADGADGIGFHVQSEGLDVLPNFEGSGIDGHRLSIVIDTWNNGSEAADESLRVILDGNVVYSRNLQDFVEDPNPGSSPRVFRLRAEYIDPRKELRLALMDEGGSDYLAETIKLSLVEFGPSWIGFSASTGGFSENHDIITWSHSAVAVP